MQFHRKSVSGIILRLAGGVILYKTNFQNVVAQSSSLRQMRRSLLSEIGLSQEHATVLFEDNQGALLMGNAQKPTKRTRHMDVKAFALQDWILRDLISLKRITTSDNYSDAMTKALGRTSFYRHMNFIMGRIVPAYVFANK